MILLIVLAMLGLVIAILAAWSNDEWEWMTICITVFIGLFTWMVLAGVYGTQEIESVTIYKVYTITDEDGTSVDIILEGHTPKNITNLMGRTCTGLMIKRKVYSAWCGGIHWIGGSTTYETIEPDPEENPYSLTYP